MPYLTPNEAADRVKTCRRFVVYREYWPYVFGALADLLSLRHWQQDGDITPEQAVQELYDLFLNDDRGCGVFVGEVKWSSREDLAFIADLPYKLVVCDGSSFTADDYPQLAAAYTGSLFDNGDGTFNLPSLLERMPLGAADDIGVTGGEATHTLTTSEIPSHHHSEQDPGSIVVTPGADPLIYALADPGLPGTTGDTGGGEAHNNMPPYTRLVPLVVAGV